MKRFITIYMLFMILLSTGCGTMQCQNSPGQQLPEPNKEQKEIATLRWRLLQAYREVFKHVEYPKLSAFGKQGYDWYWNHTWESSGSITKKERERVKKNTGMKH